MFDGNHEIFEPSFTGNTSMQPMIMHNSDSYMQLLEDHNLSNQTILADGSVGYDPEMMDTPNHALSTIHESVELAKASYNSSKYYEELVHKKSGIPQHLIQDQVVTLPQLNDMQIQYMSGTFGAGNQVINVEDMNRRRANYTGITNQLHPNQANHQLEPRSYSNAVDSLQPVPSNRAYDSELMSKVSNHILANKQ